MLAIICGHFGIATADRVVYVFHVPLFLIISGYFLSNKRAVGDFVRLRARQLLVPYYVGCAGILVAALFFNTVFLRVYGGYRELCVRILRASLFAAGTPFTEPFDFPHIGLLWFLWALFFAQIITRCLMDRRDAPVWVVALFLIGWVTSSRFKLPLSFQPGIMGVLFVYCGVLARRYDLFSRDYPVVLLGCLALFGYCVYTTTYLNIVNGYVGGHGLSVSGALAASYVVICVSKWLANSSLSVARALNWYGQLTLPAMVFHAMQDYSFPIWMLSDALRGLGLPNPAIHLVVVGLCVCWSVVGCHVSLRLPPLRSLLCVKEPVALD